MSDDHLSGDAGSSTDRTEPKTWEAEGNVAFAEPWQAQIFSMTVALNEAGAFTWKEWVEVFSTHRRLSQEAGKPDSSQTYYEDWLDALEAMAATQALASPEDQARYKEAWRGAAARTKHGQPIELQETDFNGSTSAAAAP
jgi:nitrile hydratase accessory protein